MKRGFSTNRWLRSMRALVAIILLVLLAQVVGSSRAWVPLRPRIAPVPEARKQRIARGLAAGYGLGPFQPSLEMKENADFLLTPALLVQEALSDEVVITYWIESEPSHELAPAKPLNT
jgi:hypothetical protein